MSTTTLAMSSQSQLGGIYLLIGVVILIGIWWLIVKFLTPLHDKRQLKQERDYMHIQRQQYKRHINMMRELNDEDPWS
ncbi:hypothetical protein [Rhodococcus qingshengii]|uniref:hypothetical protein n=1 Tax=Rhodococcus qingshengii TaxID=334542 RepID=UPI002941D4A9|nr:hypothetical protein [Rhodococcus qingshengii]WOI86009.1 hypothetical protein R0122_22785 [Rhodococcus qingshengii]